VGSSAVRQEHDAAGAVVCHHHLTYYPMKTNRITIHRLLLLLVIVLGAGSVLVTVKYLSLERRTHADQEVEATLERLWQNQQLCSVLRTSQEGDVSAAAMNLDLRVCGDILAVNSQLASADERTRMFIKWSLANLALVRVKNAQASAGAKQAIHPQQIEAERILAKARTENTYARVDSAPPAISLESQLPESLPEAHDR
jgi:hypothetical protein